MPSDEHIDFSCITERDSQLIEQQLARILASPQFKAAHQMQRFLSYIIDKTLLGEDRELKQYTIAIEALGFADDFDPDTNPSVRIMGGRVREKLTNYYKEEGNNDFLILTIPKGSYVPVIEKRAVSNSLIEYQGIESQGPKLGLFCFEESLQSKGSNILLNQICSTLAKELSHFLFSRLYVQIPFQGESRAELTGKIAKQKNDLDFSLLLFIQELLEDKYEMIYRLWDNESEEVIDSEIFDVYRGQPEKEQSFILNKISTVVADFLQGKEQIYWARKLLKDENSIPESYQTLAFYRYYADNLGRNAFEKAVSYCSKAIQRTPQDVIANVIFADYCRRDYAYNFNLINDPLNQGKKAAELAIRLRPDSPEAHFVLGQILFYQDEWDLSLEELNLSRSISKNHTVIEYGIGFYFCLMGHWKKGNSLVKEVMELSNSYPTWYHLTPFLVHYRKGKYKKALKEALKIITPNLLYAPLARCAVYGQLGKIKKGQKELKSMLRHSPNFLETGEQTLLRFLGSKELADKLWEGINRVITKNH